MQPRPRSPTTVEDLTRLLEDKLTPLFRARDILFVYLGGSWAQNQNRWWSDVDLFVRWPKMMNLSPEKYLTEWTALGVEASRETGIEDIEIHILEQTPLHIQFRVISEGILIYETDQGKRADWVEGVLNEYYDHAIWYERYLEESVGSSMKDTGA